MAYATIHRAAYRIYYGNISGLIRPGNTRKEKISYFHKTGGVNGDYYAYQAGAGIVSDIRIFGKNANGWREMSEIFSTTCHEFAHATHCIYSSSNYRDSETKYREAWARCYQYHLTKLEYLGLGVLAELNIVSDYRTLPITPDNKYNYQEWNKYEYNSDYPAIFVDVIDNYNQSENNWMCPNDNVYYPYIKNLETMVLNSTNFLSVMEKLLVYANPLLIGMQYEDIVELFHYYEY